MTRFIRLASSIVFLAGSIILHTCGNEHPVFAQAQPSESPDIKMQVHDDSQAIYDLKEAIKQINIHLTATDVRQEEQGRIISVIVATASIVFGFIALINLLGFTITPKPPSQPPQQPHSIYGL